MFSVLLIFCMGISFVKATACDNAYNSRPTGTISSPNYPNAYDDSLDCYTYISVSTGHTVFITFSAFATETTHDWVKITCASGTDFTSSQYSGAEIPAAFSISSCNLIKVYFHTDSSATNTGFSLTYSTTAVCENMYFSGTSGRISSPNYPSAYDNNLDCYSYISVSSGHKVIITFVAFYTQLYNDWVTVTCASGNTFTSSPYSGSQVPSRLTISSCSLVQVYFHTVVNYGYSGFSLTYNITSVVEDETHQNPTVLIVLGVAVLTIIIILVILLRRTCRKQERNTAADVGHEFDGNEHELRRREGESNSYEAGFGNSDDVSESGYDKLDAPQRRLPSIPPIYDELVHHGKGHKLRQREERNLHEAGLGDDIDVGELDYDYPAASQRRLPTMSGIYDELVIED